MTSNRTTSAMMLCLFLLVVIGVGLVIGLTIQPGAWYASLNKPFFNPPNWIFGPAWTMLYILIAFAGWRTWLTEGAKGRTMTVWGGQMVLNWLWTPLFFGAHAMSLGLAIILCLLIFIVGFIAIARDRVARLCFFPYALWVGFASVLNASLIWLNG
ncbi:tryptophan-rich sensory protein [Rhizobium anhuiense]|uniref:TspO/MBR family protein n=1 Tax=Rhizobium anhuiense TaxID=1184720 RepID=UPI001441442C|nr:TspO/MBR family protein [Rhizobium anhuiense]NKM59382.1 tryptophan-rich sensory protein [Rhizobium anhuiense]